MPTAIFLGRFQPFHLGHHKTVEKYKQEYSDFTVVIGSSGKSRTKNNPLTYEERSLIIEACHPNVNITGLKDEDRGREGYPDWTNRLIDKTSADVVITQNELVKRLVNEYSSAEIVQQELYRPDKISGDAVREAIRSGKEWHRLVPPCCIEKIEEFKDVIKKTG